MQKFEPLSPPPPLPLPPSTSTCHLAIRLKICFTWPLADHSCLVFSLLPQLPPHAPSSPPALCAEYANFPPASWHLLPRNTCSQAHWIGGGKKGAPCAPRSGGCGKEVTFWHTIMQKTDRSKQKSKGKNGGSLCVRSSMCGCTCACMCVSVHMQTHRALDLSYCVWIKCPPLHFLKGVRRIFLRNSHRPLMKNVILSKASKRLKTNRPFEAWLWCLLPFPTFAWRTRIYRDLEF